MHDASKPLVNSRHEAFARAIAQGHRLGPAYERSGFAGKSPRLSRELRHRQEVDDRIRWLLEERVRADTRAYSRREKRSADLRERVLAELETIAFSDPGEILNWERTPVLNADGEVTGFESTLQVKDSAKLSREARVGIKSVFTKRENCALICMTGSRHCSRWRSTCGSLRRTLRRRA